MFSKMLIIFGILYSCSGHNWTEIAKKLKKGLLQTDYVTAQNSQELIENDKNFGQERFCFLGDTGVNSEAQKNVANKIMNPSECTRIFHLGDIIYPVGIKSVKDKLLQTHFYDHYKPFKTPFYYVLGNHEYYAHVVSPWLEVPKKYENLKFPYFYYYVKLKNICFVAGDTTPFARGSYDGPRAKSQIKWLGSIKKKLKDCSFKIFFSHHSYETLNRKRKPPLKGYKKNLRLFFEKNVLGQFDLIFSGHDHALAYIGNFKGTDQYISGAGGKYTYPVDPRMDLTNYKGDKGPGYIVVSVVDNNNLKLEIKNLEKTVYEKNYSF